uniref:B30.2/SPRY domain-containing protein n=1 Tax=Oreochromis aureus TaxID=47969 RepID=A0AAZ1X5D7_OREAU
MDQCEDREEGVPPSKTTLCGEHERQTKAQRNQPGAPPSCVSLKSDRSKESSSSRIERSLHRLIESLHSRANLSTKFSTAMEIERKRRLSPTKRDFPLVDLTEFGQSYGSPQTDNTRHMDINVEETLSNREIQQTEHCAKIFASYSPNQSLNAVGMGNYFEEILPNTEEHWGENSDDLEFRGQRLFPAERDFPLVHLTEFGQSYGSPQTDSTRHMDINVEETLSNREDFPLVHLMEFGQSHWSPQTDNTRHMDINVEETLSNREILPLLGLTDSVPSFVSLQSDFSKDMGIDFKERQNFAMERNHYMQNLNGSVVSHRSLQSDFSKDMGIDFKERQHCGRKRTHHMQSLNESVVSHLSLLSDLSKDMGIDFKERQHRSRKRISSYNNPKDMNINKIKNRRRPARKRVNQQSSEDPSGQSAQQHQTQLNSIFMMLEDNIITFVKNELKKIQKVLGPDYPECLESQRKDNDEVLEGKDEEQRSSREAFIKITLNFLRRMKQEKLADCLENKTPAADCQRNLKSTLKKKFQCVFEGIAKAGNPTLLNQIYTELYITEGGTAEVNDEHEVRQIETASRKPDGPETTISQENIFKHTHGRDEPIRTVLTKGVAGIGKTVLTQKYTLDWAEDKANQEIQFIFPFAFRELNVLKEETFSLVELVHLFFTETKEAGICKFEDFQVLFIFDGLDECRLPLDFHKTKILTDPTKSTSVDVLLINLIRGNLLPSAHLWITTRPAAANQIPSACVDIETEVRGFTDPQKEEYFRKRFRDEEQASRIISHIKTSRSLHIMCHIPVFCWITATVLEDVLKTGDGGQLPKTLTDMYIHFLVVQAKVKKVKYDGGAETDPHWNPESRKMMESLGKLAFDQLEKGNLIFYESDLTECGIDIRTASVYSGVFTQIFKEEKGLYQDKVYCFIHLSVQEFLAALHVHLTFINSGLNLLEEQTTFPMSETRQSTFKHFHQSAVDKALESPNGHLDLFLRFLLGLCLQTNQTLLRGLLTQTESSSRVKKKTAKYIMEKLSENLSAEKSINLFHCLNELNDRSLVEKIQQSLRSGSLSTDKLSPAQWSALVFILLSSEKDLDVFDLKKYSASEEALLRLLPVVKASNKALLSGCNLSERSCKALSSVSSSSLRGLDLSNNILQDLGVKYLSVGLESPHCTLETLSLRSCNLSKGSCETLSSVLSSKSCNLKELDLSNNDLQDSGMKILSVGLKSPHCTLETLSLSGCLITEEGCTSLLSSVNSKSSCLRELDLTYNYPSKTLLKQLFITVEDMHCALDMLRVEPTGVQWLRPGLRKYSCELTLDVNTAHRKLKLSDNNRKVTCVKEDQSYPDYPDRFDFWKQLLCRRGLTGRCYWEVEWRGKVDISVSYRRIRRKGDSGDCKFGWNDQSWSLSCSDGCYSVSHNKIKTSISSSPSSSCSSSVSNRVAVYVDCPAGTLSFYRVSSDTLIHIHTFNTTFTQTLYPGFGVWADWCDSSVCLYKEVQTPFGESLTVDEMVLSVQD